MQTDVPPKRPQRPEKDADRRPASPDRGAAPDKAHAERRPEAGRPEDAKRIERFRER